MFQEIILARDQRLHGKSNFNEWNFFISKAAESYGIKEFLEVDIIGHLNNEFFIYNPDGNDAINSAIKDIITNLNLPIPIQEPTPVQTDNAVQVVVNSNTPPAINNNALNSL